jgi:hypothetical protein
MPAWLLLFPILLAALGLFVVVRGVRGRVVDDHPLCRACGFDLIGLPVEVRTCSECGVDVSSPRAIRIGHRRRRPGMALLGLSLMAPTLIGAALLAWMKIGDVKWIEHAPYWYVARQSRTSVATDRDAALLELKRRILANQLSPAQVKPLTDAALAAQADLNVPWSAAWGDLIESAQVMGRLSGANWKQYLANAPQYKLVARPEVRRGDELPLRIAEAGARCGRRGLYVWSETVAEEGSDLIVPRDQGIGGRSGGSISTNGGGSTGHVLKLDPKLLAAAADGPKTIRVALKLDISPNQTNSQAPGVATKTIHLQTTWNLVPADAPTIKLIDDPGARAAIEKATRITSISASGSYVNLSLQFDPLPVPLAHKIILRADGREWPVSGIYVKANTNSGWGTGASVKDFDADVVDVILRPDAKTALNTIDMHEYWSGEVVVKDVKVKWPTTRRARPGPASRPTVGAGAGTGAE